VTTRSLSGTLQQGSHVTIVQARTTRATAGLAMFVLVGFLLPVPILVWLDRPIDRSRGR
jgi:hypothetical protein